MVDLSIVMLVYQAGYVQIPIRCSKSVPHVRRHPPSPRRRARIRDVASGVQAFSHSLDWLNILLVPSPNVLLDAQTKGFGI